MHSVLLAAHEAAPETAAGLPPAHRGVDANPQLGSFGFCGVALFLAASVADDVAPKERTRFTAWVSQAREIYGQHARAEGTLVKVRTKTQRKVLSKEAKKTLHTLLKGDQPYITLAAGLSLELSAANLALLAAYDTDEVFGGSTVATGARSVAARIAPKRKKAFLIALDEVLLREELRAMLVRRNDPLAARVNACVWRAASGKARAGRAAGAQVSHWLGTLDDGSFILIWKVGARWQVASGPREDVLATVPNEFMASALAAVAR